MTTGVLESIACLALRARLRECGGVQAAIACDAWSLLRGRVDGVKLSGQGWRSPLDLTARQLEATVGEATLDPVAALLQRQIALTNVPVGTARVVFDGVDFGNFLAHPLVADAAVAAVAGSAFVFERSSTRVAPPSAAQPEGCVECAGTWRGDGQRYRVTLLPVTGRGVQVHAVPLSSGARASSASIIDASLTTFFSGLTLDLQGAEFTFMSLRVLPAELGSSAGGQLELNLRLVVKRFPPLDVQF